MLSVTYSLFSRLVLSEGIPRRDTAAFCTVAILHVAALAIMATSEVDLVGKAAYLLVWGLLNFLWLALFRRPVASALISLIFIVVLVLLSQFKHDKLWMTVDFVDLMIIDKDTSAFLLTALPSLRLPVGLLATTAVALLVILNRLVSANLQPARPRALDRRFRRCDHKEHVDEVTKPREQSA